MNGQQTGDFTTLRWIKQELDNTLQQALRALQSYVEDPSDSSQIQCCANSLHQVQGTLRMVELYGAAMVAEEMERLAQDLLSGAVSPREDTYSVLMRGIMQLPDYMERLQSGHKDIPIVLLPLLNDLRACRGQTLLSESALFAPNLDAALPISAVGAVQALAPAELHAQSSELRTAYLAALLKWFRDDTATEPLEHLLNIFDRLRAICTMTESRRLWWVAGGVIEGVQSHSIESSVTLKLLFGKIDKEIHLLQEEGESALHSDSTRELVKNLLYYVAHARDAGPRSTQLRATYKLSTLLPSDQELHHAKGSISGHNRTLLDTVAIAIRDDLLRVKESLDIFLRSHNREPAQLQAQVEVLNRVGDTLGMLGLGIPRRLVSEQSQVLADIAAGVRPAEEALLLDMAGSLIYVESSLEDHIERLGAAEESSELAGLQHLPKTEVWRILDALMREAASNLAQAKQEITSFIEAPWGHSHMTPIPHRLEEVSGALIMLDLVEPAHFMSAIQRFIEVELLQHQRVPTAAQLDWLADAFTSMEYYLEATREQRSGREEILNATRNSLTLLGYWPIPERDASAGTSTLEVIAAIHAEVIPEHGTTPATVDWQKFSEPTTLPEAITDVADDYLEIEEEIEEDVPEYDFNPPTMQFESVTMNEVDADIREVFLEEVSEEIKCLCLNLGTWRANPHDLEKLIPIRRSFHILKGSGRLVGAVAIAEFGWKIENLLNRVVDLTLQPSVDVEAVVARAVDALPSLLGALKGQGQGDADLSEIVYLADRLVASGEISALENAQPRIRKMKRVVQRRVLRSSLEPVHSMPASSAPTVPSPHEAGSDTVSWSGIDAVLFDILRTEVAAHLDVIDTHLAAAVGNSLSVTEDLVRALHTLNGAIATVEIPVLSPVLSPLETYIKGVYSRRGMLDSSATQVLADTTALIKKVMLELENYQPQWPSNRLLVQQVNLLGADEPDALLPFDVDIAEFDAETDELSNSVTQVTQGDTTGDAGIDEAIDASPMLARHVDSDNVPSEEVSLPVAKTDEILQAVDETWQHAVEDQQTIAADNDALQSAPQELPTDATEAATIDAESLSNAVLLDETPAPPMVEDVQPEGPLDATDIDDDLFEVFVQESADILDHADALLTRLHRAPQDREILSALQRELHTLKGGARMTNLEPIGDLSHAMESLLEAISEKRRPMTRATMDSFERGFDRLHSLIQRVSQRQAIGMPKHAIARFEALVAGEPLQLHAITSAVFDEVESEVKSKEIPVIRSEPSIPTVSSRPRLIVHADEEEITPRATQEMIRVRADTVDALVNFAGEVSIYRLRLEQQVDNFRNNLVEFEQTVSRLRHQLRTLEMETEAQILSRFQREHVDANEGAFDPLEMDRYSQLQQLSRALAESVSDLVSIQNLLDDQVRQSETLLLQQSRVTSGLQEGLMRIRMVPFESIVPSLRRLLRQTAEETGKRAQLIVRGAQGEMDRNLLDRMKAPFEHMLRNALAHGIETPEERIAAGKSDTGTIDIVVSREATEVLIRVSDDGRGLDRAAIRQRAIERGLLAADANPADSELFNFIRQTGFSTASQITQVAGRGVGMDVVYNEIKQLGGSLAIHSTPGNGSSFSIRLPFTLAVVQAILVRMGDVSYAIPMSAVQGVARIESNDFDTRIAQPEPVYLYLDENYLLCELTQLLDLPMHRPMDKSQYPILLTRAGEQRAAICVDAVIGSREIVVKSVGPQISAVPGIFGATIMGDGSVVMILDLATLLRRNAARRALALSDPNAVTPPPVSIASLVPTRSLPLIMVVDDSITMRKVTSRTLERSEMAVITAKDGLDAIDKLQDQVPDLMLLDIEMPRMDGFELATHMRNDSRLCNVPIIMITSRSGDKHRQRALEIGIDRYLGKPYQEADLLLNIREVLGASRGA